MLRTLAIVALAFISVHGGFIAHEAGHGAVSRSRRVTACVGVLFNTLLTALCYSHFSHIHRSHHPRFRRDGRVDRADPAEAQYIDRQAQQGMPIPFESCLPG